MWKKNESNSTCFSKRLKAAFRQPKTFRQRNGGWKFKCQPCWVLFKRWRFHPTKSIHFLPTAVQLQCYWSTSISMHKSCTSSYVLGDSPIQKYIFDAACQVSASNIWVTWCPASPNRDSPSNWWMSWILHTSPKTKGLEKKHRSFIASPPKKLEGAFVIYPLVN